MPLSDDVGDEQMPQGFCELVGYEHPVLWGVQPRPCVRAGVAHLGHPVSADEGWRPAALHISGGSGGSSLSGVTASIPSVRGYFSPAAAGTLYPQGMATARTRTRCIDRLNAIATSACQLEELRLEMVSELRRAIDFDRFCVLLADPDTLLEHRGLGGNDWRSEVPTLNLNTGRQADFNSLAVLVRRRDPVVAGSDGRRSGSLRTLARDLQPLWRGGRAADRSGR